MTVKGSRFAVFGLLSSPWTICAVAILVRIVLAINFVHWVGRPGEPFAANEPSHIAAHLARSEGFSSPYDGLPLKPTAQQPPLYPFLLSLIFRGAGVYSYRSLLIIVGLNILLAGGVCFLIYRVGKRWFSTPSGLVASWTWALVPFIAAPDLYISNYLLATAFILVSLLIVPVKHPTFFGIWLGVGALLNPMLLLTWVASWKWMPTKRAAVTSLLIALAVTFPWELRNYLVMGHVYIALRDSFGQALYVGNHSGMRPNATYDYSDSSNDGHELAVRGEHGFMQWKLRQSVAFIRSSPATFAVRSMKRAANFWLSPSPVFYAIVMLLCLIGTTLIASEIRFFVVTMLLLYPLAFYITETVWAASYRHPIEPLVLLFAAYATANFVAGAEKRAEQGRSIAAPSSRI